MDLSRLRPAKGAVKKGKRVGRGQGSTRGGTSTRGHNGAKSRSGYSRKQGFEGGQMPLQRRVPKFGFKNPFRVAYAPFNLSRLEEIAKANKLKKVDKEILLKLGLIHKNDLVKVLGNGTIETAVEFTVQACSESAKAAIEKAGGTLNIEK